MTFSFFSFFFAFQPILEALFKNYVVFLGNLGALVSILGGATFNFGPFRGRHLQFWPILGGATFILGALFQFGGTVPPSPFRESTALFHSMWLRRGCRLSFRKKIHSPSD